MRVIQYLAILILMANTGSALATGDGKADGPMAALGGGARPGVLPSDFVSDHQRAAIRAMLADNVEMLRAAGKLPEARAGQVSFDWPVNPAVNLQDPGIYGISNFVDQDPTFPNALLDYSCGNRTYDTTGGYNHQGIDVFTWPYGWLRMDNDLAEILAAADGVIVGKSDGNFDRSCGFNNNTWNAIFVRHADGSIAWYGHLKNGSITDKAVGDSVVAGEYLGVVGSSGNSTGPHLHLEVYDDQDQLIEPYAGVCNSLNSTSWWATQRDYHDSAINGLQTGFAPPVFPTCPIAETTNARRVFADDELVYLVAFYRDQELSQTADYTIYRPNGAVYLNWQHNSNAAYYVASYWFWTAAFNGQTPGVWTFTAQFEGQTVTREFEIVLHGDSDSDLIEDHLDNCIAVANPSQFDADDDGYGNACDADFNNDGIVNIVDLGYMKSAFFSTDAVADLDENGSVNAIDLGRLKAAFFTPPGPSAYAP